MPLTYRFFLTNFLILQIYFKISGGVWWLSGRVMEVCGFKPRWRYCVVSLSKTLYPLLSTGSIKVDLYLHERKFVGWDEKNQSKQTKF